jgi:hypothetical protein
VASHDTVVAAPQFVPPQPLAEDRAKVVVRVNAICGAETGEERVHAFVIDATPSCRMGELSAERGNLKWPAVKGAATYEVRMHALDGAFISAQETRSPAAQVQVKQPAVVSVRAACASGYGEAVYRVLAAE